MNPSPQRSMPLKNRALLLLAEGAADLLQVFTATQPQTPLSPLPCFTASLRYHFLSSVSSYIHPSVATNLKLGFMSI